MKERIRESLSRRKKTSLPERQLTPAAVLLLLYEKGGEYYILFTKRTEKVESHKGQISFPGGAREKQDANLLTTALRETSEEIGVNPQDVELLGELDDIATFTTKFAISPFVATIPYPYEFRLNADETEELIEVPLSVLLNKAVSKEDSQAIAGKPPPAYEYHGHVIWGATARILKQLLGLISSA